MKAISQIKAYLNTLPEGEAFPASALRPFASSDNVRQIVSRLVKNGELVRVARGIFAKPKQLVSHKNLLPSADNVVQKLAESTGEIITIHGAEAARKFQLTTQHPIKPVFYTSGNTRTLKIANRSVKLIHANPSRLVGGNTTAGLVISALRYMGREQVTVETINKIKQQITVEEYDSVLQCLDKMPAWLSDAFFYYQQGQAT